MALGKELPVVAMKQLPKIAEKFRSLPDNIDYLPGTAQVMADHIDTFIKDNSRYIDDERELKDIFKEAVSKGKYSKHFLKFFEVEQKENNLQSPNRNVYSNDVSESINEKELIAREKAVVEKEKNWRKERKSCD